MKSPRTVSVLIVSGGLVLGLLGCRPAENTIANPATDIHEESQAIVFSILDDVRRMIALGAGHTNAIGQTNRVLVEDLAGDIWGEPNYRIHLLAPDGSEHGTVDLKPDRPMWEPSLYAAATTALVKEAGLATLAAGVHTNRLDGLLERLMEYRGRRMEEINQELSRALAADFLDPVLHEQAAFLLGVLLLRDASGAFCDLRGLMSRMTAHLAFARALAGAGPGALEGRVAEVILYGGMNHQVGALERLAKLPAGPVLDRWKRALRARFTLDYRGLDDWPRDTLLERAAWFAAYAYSVNSDLAWRRLPEKTLNDPDLYRLGYQASYSVGLGHQLRARALLLETREIGEVAALWPEVDQLRIIEALNAVPEPCVALDANGAPRIRVISWGHWAAFFQRHLCQALREEHRFLRRMWGVPEEAAKFAAASDVAYDRLRFYPFVQRFRAEDNRDQKAFEKASQACALVVRDAPERTNPQLWGRLYGRPRGMDLVALPQLPDISEWFRHNPPAFTAHQARARTYAHSLGGMPDRVERFEAMHQIAPYDPSITDTLLQFQYEHRGRGQSINVLTNAYGPLLEFSPRIMGRVAGLCTNNPAVQETLLRRAARIDGDWYFVLGDKLLARGQTDPAARAYENGVKTAEDDVRVAHRSNWLMNYYLDHGRTNAAEQLAARAAAVYSGDGLRTMGNLRFRQERYDESLQWYLKIEDRYQGSTAVLDWWYSYVIQTDRHDYDDVIEKRLKLLFPDGIRKVSLSDFKKPPKRGVQLTSNSPLLIAAGMKPGQVIVALDGIQTDHLVQFIYVRHRLKTDEMRLIVWTGSEYKEVVASPPNHRFGVSIVNYFRE